MRVFPDSAAEDVGLSPVLARLQVHLTSPRVQQKARALEYCTSLDQSRSLLNLVAEIQDCIRFDDPIPFQAPEEIYDSLARARPEGAALTSDEFVRIRLVAKVGRLCRSYFLSRVDQYPTVYTLFETLELPKQIEDAISEVFDDEGNIRDNASPGLRRIRRELQHARASLRKSIMRVLAQASSDGYATEDQPTVRGGRMVIPVRAEAKRKISGFVQDVSATGQTVYIEPAECLDQNNQIRVLETEEAREIESIRRGLTDVVREHVEALRLASDTLAEFELRKGIAELANEIGGLVPAFNEDGIIKIENGRSPELLLHFQEQKRSSSAAGERRGHSALLNESLVNTVVPLNVTLGDPDSALVISGPNAGGKSVALKTVGVFQLMLGMGIPIPVDETSSFPFFESVFIDIGDSQSIEDDLSTYSAHLSWLKTVLEDANHQSLVLVDEAGSGTDPDEGSALFQAVLEALLDVRARTIITTHHGALKYFAHETPGIENGSMIFNQETLTPTFLFQQGEAGSSYATEMAQRVGLPASVLDRARGLLGEEKADVSSLLVRLASRVEELEQAGRAAEAARKDAESTRARFDDRLSRIKEQQNDIRSAALAEAEKIVRDANKTIERAVRKIKESEAAKEQTKDARASVDALRTKLEASLERQTRKKKSATRKRGAMPEGDTPKSNRRPESRGKKASGARSKSSATDKAQTPLVANGPLALGDRVIIDDGAVTGEVSTLNNGKAIVLFGSAQTRVDVSRLTRVAGPEKQRVTVRQERTQAGSPSIMSVKSRLDVRGMRVSEALSEVTILIDQAVVAGLKTVEVLHGKGTGALRQAISEYASSRPDVMKVDEAHPDQGGHGVSFVWLAD
jgi:DNA mismatch repair protein MutS2